MKRTKLLLAVAAIFSFWMVSCQKEFTPEDVVTTPPATSPTGNSSYLDKIYFMDYKTTFVYKKI